TVHEVSKLSGVSIRTLQYYDSIGLLKPSDYTESGYRLYDDAALERLQMILLFRELEFPLKGIGKIIDSPQFDKRKALEQQIELLTLKKEHIENLLNLARGIKEIGVKNIMDFTAFDTKKIDEYAAQAKESWGDTDAYKEYEKKSEGRTAEDNANIVKDMMMIFTEFGGMKEQDPASDMVQKQVKKLQDFITDKMYNCTKEILSGLGKAYSAPGEMNANIDRAGGDGTGEFVDRAIQIYCEK
ncbi:MerR family transcriptional regulator, partial [Eubacterium sp.]|uniref:MerR family transcriptional regulator n=1 Tax=Eubacterium sp. TaxID=142586 RepID=UPI00258BFFB2